MTKSYKNIKEFTDPWYAVSANRLVMSLGAVQGEVNCDVCIIGAGFTGLSAALELIGKGYSVIVLESNSIAHSASGRNGGQVLRGFAKSPADMIAQYGRDDAKMMNDLSLEGLSLILKRIKEYDISCDFKLGHLTAAIKDKHIKPLQNEIREWADIGHTDLAWMSKKEVQSVVKTDHYIGGLYDPMGAHLHPLNYALGLADAIQRAGGKIHDNCPALELVTEPTPRVITGHGAVNAKFVILAGAVKLKGAEEIAQTSINVTAHMIATEPLGEKRARNLITRDVAVADANFIMNYFRISNDWRLLFGGNCNYSDMEYPGQHERLRQRMLKVFPQLKMTTIQHCWRGPLNFTINRMPHMGRLTPNVYFAHGFGGHGIISTNILGKVMAEAIDGTATRFDVFDKIKHRLFPGGDALKRPLFVLGMTWYQLRDMF
jgi:gamma-glutamylputrescine oxidase